MEWAYLRPQVRKIPLKRQRKEQRENTENLINLFQKKLSFIMETLPLSFTVPFPSISNNTRFQRNPVLRSGESKPRPLLYLFPKKHGNPGEPKPPVQTLPVPQEAWKPWLTLSSLVEGLNPGSDNTCSPRSMETLSSIVESLNLPIQTIPAQAWKPCPT